MEIFQLTRDSNSLAQGVQPPHSPPTSYHNPERQREPVRNAPFSPLPRPENPFFTPYLSTNPAARI